MSPDRTRTGRRGYTIAELLVVFVIMGFVSSFVALIVGPLFAASSSQAAKIDTVQAAEKSFYRIQRDVHQSNMNGVYVCTYPAPTTCSAPSSGVLTGATVIAVITPRVNGTGQMTWDTTFGQPAWQGFQVYWLAPDTNGVPALNYAFAPDTGAGPSNPNSAASAVNAALAGTPEVLTSSVTALQIDQVPATGTIGLKIYATGSEGASTNVTSFESDTVARN